MTLHPKNSGEIELRWMRSKNGTGDWKEFKSYTVPVNSRHARAFVGRFVSPPGGATLVVDDERVGHFYRVNETNIEWTSVFPY